MNISLANAKKILRLLNGEEIPASKLKSSIFYELVTEGILLKKSNGLHAKISLPKKENLLGYLKNHHNITGLEKYIETLEKEDKSRAELMQISGDSKLKTVRTFKGFLVNSYQPIKTILNNDEFVIQPPEGVFHFIYDFESFILPADITIVGIENPENFRHISKQKHLFKDIKPLFISRYPQNQSKDFIKWMVQISNNYLHFGDFDFAGINIYISEYQKHLGDRANFFIPKNISNLLKNGNRDRYNKQKLNISTTDKDILALIEMIKKERKGLDQEILIDI